MTSYTPPTGLSPGSAWWGRVLTAGDSGGNHTVVVLPDQRTSTGRITLRTFSPVEEPAQCVQTSLAALTAVDVPDRSPWRVRHKKGEELLVHREGTVTWAAPCCSAEKCSP